jgi:hypothetical protein
LPRPISDMGIFWSVQWAADVLCTVLKLLQASIIIESIVKRVLSYS